MIRSKRLRKGFAAPAGWPGLALLLILFLAPMGAQGQAAADWDAAREQVTRAELRDLVERLEAQAQSTAYSSRMRADARQRIEHIERRLRDGDFQVGDRILLEVEGEADLSDEYIVRSGRVVEIPIVGEMNLAGVLRSELQAAMEEHLSDYIRNPRVRTQALIRISVLGQVSNPGFYTIAAELPITDALTMAGGPTGNANLLDMRVERGSARIWEGESMETAVIRGQTLDQMNIQAGDRIVIPAGGQQRDGWETARIVSITLGSIVSLGYALSRIF
jgi:protein involved in polysaccharide export with SLBB domain